MTTIVLNEQTNQTTLAELLASAVGEEIQISDESGRLVARILLEGSHQYVDPSDAIFWAEVNIDYIRLVRESNPGREMTSNELVASVRALKQARCQCSAESMAEAEAMIDELRQEMNSDRSHDITTEELLARVRVRARAGE